MLTEECFFSDLERKLCAEADWIQQSGPSAEMTAQCHCRQKKTTTTTKKHPHPNQTMKKRLKFHTYSDIIKKRKRKGRAVKRPVWLFFCSDVDSNYTFLPFPGSSSTSLPPPRKLIGPRGFSDQLELIQPQVCLNPLPCKITVHSKNWS